MITILFFAKVRETLGESELKWDEANISIEVLLQKLIAKGEKWSRALENENLIHTVNYMIVDKDYIIQENDEIAFYPPVTGG